MGKHREGEQIPFMYINIYTALFYLKDMYTNIRRDSIPLRFPF